MDMAAGAWVRWVGAVALLCSLGACSSDDEPGGSSAGGASEGSASQGRERDAELSQLQEAVESAAEQIATGDGLRVENETGGPIALTFPNGNTAWVAAGKFVVVARACRDRLPLRAENDSGELIAVRNGPCRQRDTWTID